MPHSFSQLIPCNLQVVSCGCLTCAVGLHATRTARVNMLSHCTVDFFIVLTPPKINQPSLLDTLVKAALVTFFFPFSGFCCFGVGVGSSPPLLWLMNAVTFSSDHSEYCPKWVQFWVNYPF